MLKRYDGENEKEFIIRVCSNKQELNMTWFEIADFLNKELGYNYTESYYRKPYQNYLKTLETTKVDVKDSSEIAIELELKKLEINAERVKLQSLRNNLNKIVRETSRDELFFEMLAQASEEIKMPEFEIKNIIKEERKYVVHMADIHIGKKIDIQANKYNLDIAKERMETSLSEIVLFMNERNVKEYTLLLNGDLLEGGNLRASMLRSMEIGFVEQTIFASKLIAHFVNELSRHAKINLIITSGNHAEIRSAFVGAGELKDENMEIVLAEFVKGVLRDNKNVSVIYGKEVEFTIGNFNCIAVHGDRIKNLQTFIKDYSMRSDKVFNYLFSGHLHHNKTITISSNDKGNVSLFQCPSMLGIDEYGQMFGSCKAGFTIHSFDNKGHKSDEYFWLN